MSDLKNGTDTADVIRFSELRPAKNGRLQTKWTLTDPKQLDTVKLVIPPTHALPIIFVPGIMGSNLSDKDNVPVWLLDSLGGVPKNLVTTWAGKGAGVRQSILHPDRTQVYKSGSAPASNPALGIDSEEYFRRGWGEVSQTSYHEFLLWLEKKMNSERNPLNWSDFNNSSIDDAFSRNIKRGAKMPAGLTMRMDGVPELAENGFPVQPVTSDELLRRAKFSYPIYAFGYNWLRSNDDAAKALKKRIKEVISENNTTHVRCTQVIIVTHSMGGLVARACAKLPDMSECVVGIVHGVMPAVGAAVAYRRCKVGMADEDYIAGLVIGSDGREVSAVFAQAPGALQLLPSEEYGQGWLEIEDPSTGSRMAFPHHDPYDEIYLEKKKWWGLIKEEWLSPAGGRKINWDEYVRNIKNAKKFHKEITGYFHPNTFVFFGGGSEKKSFLKVKWKVRKGLAPDEMEVSSSEIPELTYLSVRTDGSNNLYVGGEKISRTTVRGVSSLYLAQELSYWEVRCAFQDSAGDGTVPIRSGGFPRRRAGNCILQQFELPSVAHEPAYRDYPSVKQVTYYSITKLSALARIS